MLRLLSHLTRADWLVVAAGLGVVGLLEVSKPDAAPLLLAGDQEVPAGLPPSPPGLRPDPYHLRPNAATPAPATPAPATSAPQSAPDQPAPLVTPDPGHDLTFYGPATRLEASERPQEPGQAAEVFAREAREGVYFGAFAMGSKGAFGWTSGHGTQAAARAGALAHCAQFASDCRLIGELLPADLQGDAPDTSLSYRQVELYLEARARSGPSVLVRSVDGAVAAAGGASRPEAIATALRDCERLRQRQDYLPKMPCKVVAIWD